MPAVNGGHFDRIDPFLISAGAIRGRIVRLGPALDNILRAHAYPEAVATLLAETLALAGVLAGALKYDGVFTLQIQAEGSVSLIVADVTSAGALRGYARFDAERLKEASKRKGSVVRNLLGKGYLAFTVDQGPDTDRYQGIVELVGDSLEDCAGRYFEQSEQLETAVKLAVHPADDKTGWRAGAIMIQRMPLNGQSPIMTTDEADESWNRATILMNSTRDAELLDTGLAGEALLYRLFNAEGLVVHAAKTLKDQCRCSAERVGATLRSFPRDEVSQMKDDDNVVVVVCEFCKSRYVFNDQDLDRLYQT